MLAVQLLIWLRPSSDPGVRFVRAEVLATLGSAPDLEAVEEGLPARSADGGAAAAAGAGAGLPLPPRLLRGAPGLPDTVLLLERVEAVLGSFDGGGAGEGHRSVEGVLYWEVLLERVVGYRHGLHSILSAAQRRRQARIYLPVSI